MGYLPYGFQYPAGFPYSETSPDPVIEGIRLRVEYLNAACDHSGLAGHVFAAAMDLLQGKAGMEKDAFWNQLMSIISTEQLAKIAVALSDKVSDVLPRLEFPNAIALFDCRFLSTKEWEHIRRYSIGGSEAAAVLGLSHFQSRRGLYYEKKNPPQKAVSAGLQHILDYGHAVEPYIVDNTAAILGAIHYPEYRMFAHKEYPFITCNPDGILLFPDGTLALFEAKSATHWKARDWRQGIPDYYAPQPRQYLEVFNDPRLSGGYIAACFGGSPQDRVCHFYTRDKAEGAKQVGAIVAYWNDYIVPDVLPPLSGNPDLDAQALYKYNSGTHKDVASTPLPPCTKAEFLRYEAIQAERSELSKTISEKRQEEENLLQKITVVTPEGLSICSIPDSIQYKIKLQTDVTRKTVNAKQLSVLPKALSTQLYAIAEIMKDTSWQLYAENAKDTTLAFITPKIKKGVISNA